MINAGNPVNVVYSIDRIGSKSVLRRVFLFNYGIHDCIFVVDVADIY